ncbi:MAG: alpha/beta hydrolase [Solirubrobacteraceae bacterium]|nr:alpha/beta hydrolase [Solirubrobacteraceae bacterium]
MAAATETSLPSRDASDAYGPQGRSEWLDIDWSRHLKWASLSQGPLNYVDIGEGPALVFIHGLAGSWQNWLENIPHFARTHRVIAPDLPGFGCSPVPSEKISINGYAATVDELLDSLGIERAVVVGNSMGGFIGAELAIEFSTRIERLVLVSAAGLTTVDTHNDRLLGVLRRAENVLAYGSGWFAARSDRLSRRPGLRKALMLMVAAHPDRLPAPLIAEQVSGSGKPGFMDAVEALGTYPIRDRLERIEAPTLIVWGELDRLVPLRDADRFLEAIGPNARKIVYPDTGHVAMLERPARFNADVEAFLAEDDPAGHSR